MCLSRLQAIELKSDIGYKVFQVIRSKYYGIYYGSQLPRISGKWYRASKLAIKKDNYDDPSYSSGFHVYLKMKDAKNAADSMFSYRRVIKVKFRGVVTTGFQAMVPVVVVREIMILKSQTKQSKREIR